MDLVVGATGWLGQQISKLLRERGRKVRALVRPSSAPDRIAALQELGVELVTADLKQPASLRTACDGVQHIVTTASSTLSRSDGDDLESVDRHGHAHLVAAAREAGVAHVVFTSFAPNERVFALQDAKRAAERTLIESGVPYTILQPPNFLDVWFSPALGFDLRARRARVFGRGESPLHWIDSHDVARVASALLGERKAHGQTLLFGGPEARSQRDVIAAFERATGAPFELELIPDAALREQYEARRDPLEASFAAMMLRLSDGRVQPMDNAALRALIPYEPLSVAQFVERSIKAVA
ncbi:MAG: SDR family oxidoreductase [Polyangiales bacterium]